MGNLSSQRLAVSEIFGPTFQGEGPNLGMPCLFLRLYGCNLACVWCDTPYTWDAKNFTIADERTLMTIPAILTRLDELGNNRVKPIQSLIITGGEPMLQQKNLTPLTQELKRQGWWLEMETAGSVVPDDTALVHQYNVSPKLESSGNGDLRINPDALRLFVSSNRAIFKFVVCGLTDFDEIDDLVNTYNLSPVFIMPEGIDTQAIAEGGKAIASAALQRGYNLTTRLHIQLFGNVRRV